jgi:hypothetical protein
MTAASLIVIQPDEASTCLALAARTRRNWSDRIANGVVLDALIKRWPWVKYLFGDAAYANHSGGRRSTALYVPEEDSGTSSIK